MAVLHKHAGSWGSINPKVEIRDPTRCDGATARREEDRRPKSEGQTGSRQFYFSGQIGKPKVAMLEENLRGINPDIQIDARIIKLDTSNVFDVFNGCDIVVEAFDKAECKKMIGEAWVGKAKLLVSASGIAGYGNSDEITVRKAGDGFYIIGDGVSEAAALRPPCSPRVNVAAAKMADIILKRVIDGQI